MSVRRLRERRNKLWNQDPRCRNCKVITILPEDLLGKNDDGTLRQMKPGFPEKRLLDKMATIEHIHSRFNPLRGTLNGAVETTTLFCRKCNHLSNIKELKCIPLEELHRRSRYRPNENMQATSAQDDRKSA